jgi:anti-sigma factor RsiW
MIEAFRLIAYVDGELAPDQASEIERLIEGDDEARALVRVYRETAKVLREACADGFYAAPRASEAIDERRCLATSVDADR